MSTRAALIGLAAVIVACGGCYMLGMKHGLDTVSADSQIMQIQAAEAKGGETAAKADADAARALAQDWADRALDAGKRIEDLKARLAKIRPVIAPSVDQPPITPGVDGADPEVVLLRELTSAQDEKIASLEGQVTAQGQQIKGLEKALTLADKRADIQEQASRAALAGLKKAQWLGRAEGFVSGAALGYLGGRIR